MSSLFSVTNITGTATRRWLGACSQLLNSFSFMFSAADTRVFVVVVCLFCLFVVFSWQILFYPDKSCFTLTNRGATTTTITLSIS